MSFLLGLTGSIGTGKSTTANMFRDLSVPVWDADAAVHQLYDVGGAAVGLIQTICPDAIVDGAVSRAVLKAKIQADSTFLQKIEAVVHPLVAVNRAQFIDQHHTAPLVIFDIPLLFETDADDWLDAVLVVTVPTEVQKERVMARPGMTEADFHMILSRQMPDAEKQARADFVIQTLELDETRMAVQNLIAEIKGQLDA